MTDSFETGRFAAVSRGDLAEVSSGVDVARIAEQMVGDLCARPDDWENSTLERFLDARASGLRDDPGGQASWRPFAAALVRASGYE
jgi:hypothetical protein